MTGERRSLPVLPAALLMLVSMVPAVRRSLEASMTAQMLVQLPLLVAVGWLASRAMPARVRLSVIRDDEYSAG